MILLAYNPQTGHKSYSTEYNTPDIIFDLQKLPKPLNTASYIAPTPPPIVSPTPCNDKLTIVRENEKTLGIYSSIPGGKLLLTKFVKKDWGTWNIGGWYIVKDKKIPSTKHYLLVGGSSDWEYVFRVTNKINSTYEFSGGNHGNEILKDFKLFENDTNRELNLKVGEKIKISQLKIVEQTCLTINKKEASAYADVQRSYIISPSEISLSVNFNFISDVYMGASYICMLPSNKSYGRYIRFIDSGNVYETPSSGTTMSSTNFENFIGKEKTRSVEIWGDSNPSYIFEVGIENKEMCDDFNNELKVFYWDLNTQSNKLYFSKYDNEDYTLIKSGTQWSNLAYWKFKVSPN